MRKIFQMDPKLNWDDPLPLSEKKAWISLITEAIQTGKLEFKRSCKPANALPKQGPVVVGFADFAIEAFDGRIYLRYEIESPDDKQRFEALQLRGENLMLCCCYQD